MQKALAKINREISRCTKCPLYKSRTHAVSGDGNIASKIFLLGEAPGSEEDRVKKTFVGRSGKILDKALLCCSLSRKDVYITNAVKCRPPKNRRPKQNEINTCKAFLIRQLKLIKPKIIITLGCTATAEIFKIYKLPYKKISFLHGKNFLVQDFYGEIKIIPSYHPAAALRSQKISHLFRKDFNKIIIKSI